ncbi:MAG TPA: hypothetical protein VLB86_02780 [Gaiellaceae bacterium]|nr:hypothetical protein [Gaiellaceae bacterium]
MNTSVTPDWPLVIDELPILGAIVRGLSIRSGCPPEAIVDALAEWVEAMEDEERRPALRLVGDGRR